MICGGRAGRMAIVPKKFSDEFKRDAVALAESGTPQRQACRDLGISKTALQLWVRDARFATHGMTRPRILTSNARWRPRCDESVNWSRRTSCCVARRRTCPRPTSRPQMTLLCLSSSHRGLEFAEDRAADVALEAAADLAVGAPFSASTGDVVARGFVVAHSGADDHVEGAVELAVS